MPYSPTVEQRRRAYEAFRKVLDDAVLPYDVGQLRLFEDEVEVFIRREVERKLYNPTLPNAKNKERAIVERLKRLARDRDWAGASRASHAARMWEAMLPSDPRNPGRYYYRRRMSPKANKTEFEWLTDVQRAAETSKEWDKKWFCEMMLEGLPEGVSDFELECRFLLRDPRGQVTRLVRLKNMQGEVSQGPEPGGCLVLDPKAFAAPERFREWCLAAGNFNWSGNQTELHKLQADVGRSAAWRVLNRVDSIGWRESTGPAARRSRPGDGLADGIWFYGDCAYRSDGKLLLPNKDEDDGAVDEAIIWDEGQGYYLARKGRESDFLQGRPMMRPGEKLEWQARKGEAEAPGKTEGSEPLTVGDGLAGYWREVCRRMYETAGGYEAWLGMGAMMAYGAAPEVFREYGCFPGLFVHGQMQSGKTKLTSWLMAMQGFSLSAGLGIVQTCTAVGMLQEAENYSNLAVWLDEFREAQVEPMKVAILRNAFDRQVQAKWSPDGMQRTIRTAYVVSGESTSSDAATRSRYPHIQMSASKRLVNHLEWMQGQKRNFYVFWRLVMEQRVEFVQKFREVLRTWTESKRLSGVSDRERMVYGTSYAGWMSMVALLGSHDAREAAAFREWLVGYALSASADVTSETNVNVFWTDLITAYEAGEIPLDCFRIEAELQDRPPGVVLDSDGRSTQGRWTSYRLFFKPEGVLAAMQIFLSKQRQSVVLKRKDLRDQLSKTPYWVEGTYRKWFGHGSAVSICWGIHVDKHPLGYQMCSDEDVAAFLVDANAGDPRKGPLFSIIEALEDRERMKE